MDSVSLRSIEVLSDMDELLRESGKYGIHFIMTAHPTLNLLKINVNEHINNKVLHGLSIEEVAQTGVIITDAMSMGAICNEYSSGESAVQAILAGCDIVLMPYDLVEAFESVVNAVNNKFCKTISQVLEISFNGLDNILLDLRRFLK